MEADLAATYPRDGDQLPAFYAGELSLRRLWVLVSGLPQRCHTARELYGEAVDWDVNAHLLAQIANLLKAGNAQRGGKRVPPGEFIEPPRPREPVVTVPAIKRQRAPETGTWQDLDALFTAD